jgi:hypothetical protein
MRFHMTHVTEEFHQVRTKWFLGLWYVRRKLCTYLASRLAICPNKPKWAFAWASSPWSTIRCIKNDFWAYSMFGANHDLSCVKISNISKWTETSFHLSLIILKFHRVHPKLFLRLWYYQHKPCTYLAPTLTLSLNRPKWDSTWPTSPRRSIGSVQNVSKPMVCSAQTVHLSCVKISTISKRTEMSFYLSLVT